MKQENFDTDKSIDDILREDLLPGDMSEWDLICKECGKLLGDHFRWQCPIPELEEDDTDD